MSDEMSLCAAVDSVPPVTNMFIVERILTQIEAKLRTCETCVV